MIESLSTNDPFDAVFFFEEEFDKISELNDIYFYHKNLISDVLKYNLGNNIDLSNLKMRMDDIWKHKTEKELNSSTPLFGVWFVSNVFLNEEILNNKPNCIILFPRTNTKYGDIIILEDFFKWFFRDKLYVYFDKEGNISPLEDKTEKLLFETQLRFITDFVKLFQIIYDKDHISLIDKISNINLTSIKAPINLDDVLSIGFIDLIVLASLRRWLKSYITHLMGGSEFDENIMIPFIASYLYERRHFRNLIFMDWIEVIDWKQPRLVKSISRLVLYMMKILESAKFRSLDLTRRYIEFHRSINNIDPNVYTNDIQELGGILDNVRKKIELTRPITYT